MTIVFYNILLIIPFSLSSLILICLSSVDCFINYMYFFHSTQDILKETPVVIRGTKKQWARFGTAIVNLKDISNDDIAGNVETRSYY